jgi:ABC-type multidrug transport system fused ATPase/permease subunit
MNFKFKYKKDKTYLNITKLWLQVKSRRKAQFLFILILMIISSFLEIVSIGALIPFITILLNPNVANTYLNDIIGSNFLVSNLIGNNFILLATSLFCLAVLVAGAFRVFLIWITAKISFSVLYELSSKVYKNILYQPYLNHASTHSSHFVDIVNAKTNAVVYNLILPLLMIAASTILAFLVLLTLFFINYKVALFSIFTFITCYLFLIFLSKKNLNINSKLISLKSTELIKFLQESLGGIRDVIIGGTQNEYVEIYKKIDSDLKKVMSQNQFYSNSPKFIIETFGIIIIALIASILTSRHDASFTFSMLAVIALSAQRLLPAFQQIYSSWVAIKLGEDLVFDVFSILNIEALAAQESSSRKRKMAFNKNINLKNITFKYANRTSNQLERINFKILKGDKVGIIGKTGSGKSTLIDLVMGLISPQQGQISIDGIKITKNNVNNWQKCIAHVPQNIFLKDASFISNIAFGVSLDQINFSKVIECSKIADLYLDIMNLPDGFNTLIGERGSRLSGGQKQRLGIARALYKDADLIIFDEATSALDDNTEAKILNAITAKLENLTVITVAHRDSALKGCNKVFRLKDSTTLEQVR